MIRLIFLFFLLYVLQGLQLSLLVKLLILEIHDDFGGLHVLLRVNLVDFPEELALIEALLPVIDHVHGELHLFGKHPTIVGLADVVEQLVNCLKKDVLVDEAGEEDAGP